MIRVLALLHVVLVTTGAMDSSWAMAKSFAMSHAPITKEAGSDWRPRRSGVGCEQPFGSCGLSPEHAQHAREVAGRQVQIPETPIQASSL